MSAYQQKKTELGFASLLEVLSGELRRGPASRLMQRVIRERPEASTQEVMRLFRDAAVDDQAAFDDLVAIALRRELPKQQERAHVSTVLTLVKGQQSS